MIRRENRLIGIEAIAIAFRCVHNKLYLIVRSDLANISLPVAFFLWRYVMSNVSLIW